MEALPPLHLFAAIPALVLMGTDSARLAAGNIVRRGRQRRHTERLTTGKTDAAHVASSHTDKPILIDRS